MKNNLINQMAQELDCGNNCYYNPKTEEFIALPDFDRIEFEPEFEEAFKEDINRVKKNKSDYIIIEVPDSRTSFKIMEDFTAQIPDDFFRQQAEMTLSRSKPFRNFKYLIDQSEYRQDWFDFKQKELEKIVTSRLTT